MKLPGISYEYGVQSLGRQSVDNFLRASAEKTRAVMTAFDVSAGLMDKYATEYRARQIRIGTEKAALGMAQAESDFAKRNAGKVYYKASEVPEGIDIRRTTTSLDPDGNEIEGERTDIPAYEVRPDMYKRFMDKQINALAQNIPEGQERDSWVRTQGEALEEVYGRFIVSSMNEQKKAHQDIRVANYKLALGDEKWDNARVIVSHMEVSEPEKRVYYDEVNKEQEMSSYNHSHMDGNVDRMYEQIESLQADTYAGMFNKSERDKIITYLLGGISREQNKNATADAVAKSLFMADMRDAQNILGEGRTLTPQMMFSLESRAHLYPGQAGQMRNVIDDFNAQQQVMGMIADNFNFSEIETAIQKGLLQNMEGDIHDLSRSHAQQKMLDQMKSLYAKNPVAFAEQYLGYDIIPVTPKNIAKTGKQRIALRNAMVERFGAVDTILKPSERANWIDFLNNASVANKMDAAKGMFSAMGNDAGAVIEELVSEGAARSFLMAGDAINRGNHAAAKAILLGEEAAKANPNYTKGIMADLDIAVTKAVGQTYGSNFDLGQANKAAVLNAYIGLATMEGVPPGIYKSDIMKRATNIVLKDKIHEFKGHPLELPPNFTADGFDSWMRNVHSSYFQNWNFGNGWSAQKVWTGVQNGSLYMQSVGPGKYHLINGRTGQAIFDYAEPKNPTVLIFTLDKPYISQGEFYGRHPEAARAARGAERRIESQRRLTRQNPELDYEYQRSINQR